MWNLLQNGHKYEIMTIGAELMMQLVVAGNSRGGVFEAGHSNDEAQAVSRSMVGERLQLQIPTV